VCQLPRRVSFQAYRLLFAAYQAAQAIGIERHIDARMAQSLAYDLRQLVKGMRLKQHWRLLPWDLENQ
jgi:hypothetical protein